MDGLDIGVGLAMGLERGVQNFFSAMQYVKQNKMQMEKDAIAMKMAKLQIQHAEYDVDPEVIAKKKELLGAQIKASKTLSTFNEIRGKQILSATKNNLKDTINMFREYKLQNPDMADQLSLSSSGDKTTLSIKPPSDASIYMRGETGGTGGGIKPKREGGVFGGVADFLFGKKTATPQIAPSPAPEVSSAPTDIESQLPDAAKQDEGDEMSDEASGRKWVVTNGEWIEQ